MTTTTTTTTTTNVERMHAHALAAWKCPDAALWAVVRCSSLDDIEALASQNVPSDIAAALLQNKTLDVAALTHEFKNAASIQALIALCGKPEGASQLGEFVVRDGAGWRVKSYADACLQIQTAMADADVHIDTTRRLSREDVHPHTHIENAAAKRYVVRSRGGRS